MKLRIAALFLLACSALAQATPASRDEDFAPCTDAGTGPELAGSLCAHFPIPGGKGTLLLRQFPSAAPSRGQVWLLAGESGSTLYPLIGTLRKAFPGYDLIVPDRRGSAHTAALDLQAEIDHYAGGGATLLYGATQGSEVVLKALPLVRTHRIEAVILDSPPLTVGGIAPEQTPSPGEQGLDLSPPRTLVLQGDATTPPPAELDKKAPVTTYAIEGAPSFLMLTVPECAAPLVHDFVEGGSEGGAPCAARLSIRF